MFKQTPLVSKSLARKTSYKKRNSVNCLFNRRSSKFYIPAHSTCQRPLDIGEISNIDPEVKKTIEVFVDKANDQSNHINEAIEESYGLGVTLQAKEVISYQSDVRKITSLSVSEVNEAEREIVTFLRKQKFKEELSALSIYKLDPALENSLIPVGGCLHQAPILFRHQSYSLVSHVRYVRVARAISCARNSRAVGRVFFQCLDYGGRT